jgi:hypothetical protein
MARPQALYSVGLLAAAWRHVAAEPACRDEYHAVSGRIFLVQFLVSDSNPFSWVPVWAAERWVRAVVDDDGRIQIVVSLKSVGSVCAGVATARHERTAWPHKGLNPLAHIQ